MEKSDKIIFFAARRGFYTDGISFIVIVGLSPNADKLYRVTERKLLEKGIQLGSFLYATVISSEVVKHFRLTNYPLKVAIDENFAFIDMPSAEFVQYGSRVSGFCTNEFGIVNSVDKNIPPGFYRIKITASRTSSKQDTGIYPLSAEVIGRYTPPVRPGLNEDVHSLIPPSNSTSYNTLHNRTSNNYCFSQNDVNKTRAANSNVLKEDLYEPISNNTLQSPTGNNYDWDSETLDELIAKLPNLSPPIPKPRTIKPVDSVPKNVKIENKIFGNGFNFKESSNKKMTAFVVNIFESPASRVYFLWICDIQEEAVFFSGLYELEKGHFFEGIFVKPETKRREWKCLKYLNPVNPLIEGHVVDKQYGWIELKVTVLSYHPSSETSKYSTVSTKYLGKVIDKNNRLPANCIGRDILIQRMKFGADDYQWVVTEKL